MLCKPARQRRRAAAIVEAAIVLPLTFLLILGLLVGGMGVFRYQETAHLARLTARYAAVHGGQYTQENAAAIQTGSLPTVNENYLAQNVAAANAVALDPSQLSVSATITTHSGTYDWNDTKDTNNRSPYSTYTDKNGNVIAVTNTVNVTVTYQWLPELYLVGPITLTSTSVLPISY